MSLGVEKWVYKHEGKNKVVIEITYIPHVCVLEFFEGEWGDVQTLFK
jgi:hypothetical protein